MTLSYWLLLLIVPPSECQMFCLSMMWLCLFCEAVTKQVTTYSFREKFYASSIYILNICLFRDSSVNPDTDEHDDQQGRIHSPVWDTVNQDPTDTSVRTARLRAKISTWNLLNISTWPPYLVPQTEQLCTMLTIYCTEFHFTWFSVPFASADD
jgi:hypothetical protein